MVSWLVVTVAFQATNASTVEAIKDATTFPRVYRKHLPTIFGSLFSANLIDLFLLMSQR